MAITTDAAQSLDLPSQPNLLTDEALLVRYRDGGDENAFRELICRCELPLSHYLRRYLHDGNQVDEVVQATFLKLAQHSDRFLPDHRVRPWLYTIATHLAIDALRAAGRHRTVSLNVEHADDATLGDLLVDHHDAPSAHAEEEERSQWLHGAVDELPARLREPLKLVYFDGLEYAAAARRLGIPLGTLKSRLHESLLKLNQHWAQS
ncbi:MAG TPA: RNA polymerase sigma factor [Pirellulales bacterium]|nr:RNA polymerase sigma factor [Pirellulales bacterium]